MTETQMLDNIETRVTTYVNALNSGTNAAHHHFTVSRGRKYIKVIDSRPEGGSPVGGGSVHAFIEIATGYVYKPAGWAKPAEHIRFYLMRDGSYSALLRHAARPDAYAGAYLYIR